MQHPTQIIKSQDTIIYVGALTNPDDRPSITPATTSGTVSRPSDRPTAMFFLGGVTNASLSINDNNQEYYVLGNGGFTDSVKTTRSVTTSITSYLQKDFEDSAIEAAFDEAMDIVMQCRNRDRELYVEIYKSLGDGGLVFDFTCYAACVANYTESYPADNLLEATFDLQSRGAVAIGKLTLDSAETPSTIPGPNASPNSDG